jgi:hypothetical protein
VWARLNIEGLLGFLLLVFVLVVDVPGGPSPARAERAVPRAVFERDIGPLRYAAELPESFRGCPPAEPVPTSEESRILVSSPAEPTRGVVLYVNVDCLDGGRNVVTCSPTTARLVKSLLYPEAPHAYRPESKRPRCQLAPSSFALKTSRGIGLGDSYKKIVAAYGPPSRKASVRQGDEFYIVYTKGREVGREPELQLRFAHGRLYAILIWYGEGELQWK